MAPPRRPVKDRLIEQVVFARQRKNGCWIWVGACDKDGYGLMTIGRGHQYRVHRVSHELFKGKVPRRKMVCHTCDTPACVNPNHLYIGDAKSNAVDRSVRGRNGNLCGSDHPNSKLTPREVADIRIMRRLGYSLNKIASLYHVSFQHVSAICLNKTRTIT